jgi:HK97 family phage major capsid protein
VDPEIKALVEESQKLLGMMRDKDKQAAEEREKYGKELEETKAQIAAMDKRFEEADERIEKLLTEAKSKVEGERGNGVTEMDEKAAQVYTRRAGREVTAEQARDHRKAFLNWMRYGAQEMDAAERKNLVEDATGELIVMFDLDAELYRVLPQLNVIRALCGNRQTTKDRLRARSITELSVGWGKIEVSGSITASSGVPSEAYMYVEDLYGLSKIGEDELMDADFALESYVASSFGIAIANAEEAAFAAGPGHGSLQPLGMNAASITGFDGTAPVDLTSVHTDGTVDLDEFIELEYNLKPQYARNASYLVHRQTASKMRRLKDADNRYLWSQGGVFGGVIERQPDTFNGYPVTQSMAVDQFPTATATKFPVVFGDFKAGYLVLDRLGMTVQRLNELYAESGLVGFKVHRRVGGGVIRGEALSRLKSAHV